MLFSPVSIVAALSLVTSVVSAPTLTSTQLSKRATDAQTISTFNQLTTHFKEGKTELDAALASVDKSNPTAVLKVVKPILENVDDEIKAARSTLTKRDVVLIARQNGNSMAEPSEEVAEAIANAVQAFIDLIQPIQDLIAENPVLGALLRPLLSNLTTDLVYVLTGLGLVLTGVLALVGDLLSGLPGGLGLGGLLAGLGL